MSFNGAGSSSGAAAAAPTVSVFARPGRVPGAAANAAVAPPAAAKAAPPAAPPPASDEQMMDDEESVRQQVMNMDFGDLNITSDEVDFTEVDGIRRLSLKLSSERT